MLRTGIVIAAFCLMVPALAQAQSSARGAWEVTLGASGNNGPNFNGFAAAGTGSIGYFFADPLELKLTQSAAYSDLGGARGWDASTELGLDFHFLIGDTFLPYVGANIGYVYGNEVRNTWEAAPEAGIKCFINPTTFIYGSVEYQFFFNQSSTASSALRNGQFIYGVGIGFRF